jgi:hypothetical protein
MTPTCDGRAYHPRAGLGLYLVPHLQRYLFAVYMGLYMGLIEILWVNMGLIEILWV